MPTFPPMDELPPIVDAMDWAWKRYRTPSFPSKDFWVGTDRSGNTWLTKLRGSFYAYREIVFARLAQKMGWSCQSTAFLRLSNHDATTLGVSAHELQAAHWFMQEHARGARCSDACVFDLPLSGPVLTVDDLKGSKITHLLDLPKSHFAACLFGANEPPGCFISAAHEFVIIDCEQMFSTGPCDLSGTRWWNLPDGSPSAGGRALAAEVCREVAALSSDDLIGAMHLPPGVNVPQRWPIAPRVAASHAYATAYVASPELP